MTSRQALTALFNETNRLSSEKPKHNTYELWVMREQIQKDLELLDCFLNVFKSAILEATDSRNRRGDNVVADQLRDEFGSITLNKLKERLENEKDNK